jgi:predicted DNA binding protein
MVLTLRGVPKGISGFLAATRLVLPPDKVSVISQEEPKHEALALLGERQLEILNLAVHHGYYQDPRGISVSALAEKLEIARSTLGEHLQSAEAALVKWVIEED